MKKVILFLFLVAMFSCTDEDGARRALKGAGYTHIVLTGYSPLSCSDDDTSCTGFSAVGPTGRTVTGVVGCGLACKGCTIRTF